MFIAQRSARPQRSSFRCLCLIAARPAPAGATSHAGC